MSGAAALLTLYEFGLSVIPCNGGMPMLPYSRCRPASESLATFEHNAAQQITSSVGMLLDTTCSWTPLRSWTMLDPQAAQQSAPQGRWDPQQLYNYDSGMMFSRGLRGWFGVPVNYTTFGVTSACCFRVAP